MTRRGRGLTEDERALWKGVTRHVAPLRPVARKIDIDSGAPGGEAPRKSVANKSAAAPPAAPRPTAPPPLMPLDRRLKQRIARGAATIEARLDLHGMTQAQAHAALARFLRKAQADGVTLALVITGKGVRGAGEERGVLRRQVPLWLKLPEFRDCVVGFEAAATPHGGEGALYVRLRKRR
jgi:DNA-nicking Smr family endonuclease